MLSEPELQLLKERISESLAELQALSLPDTLGHLDLNPGNIIVSPQKCTFLDWAEAYVGNPVFSLQYLLEHFRRSVIADQISARRLKSAYVEEWRNRVSSTEVNEALQLSPLLSGFAYAASSNGWRDQEILDDPRRAGYMRSLTRRMNREANQLNERRSPCLC
jgi:thiamine kinase-like enzyme